MPLLHQTFLLSRKFFKNFSKTFSYLAVYSFFPVFRDKNNVIFAFPTRMIYTTVHFKISPFVYPFEDSQKGDISSNSENVKRFWVPQWNWGFTRLIIAWESEPYVLNLIAPAFGEETKAIALA
jgi:hypothetical protein